MSTGAICPEFSTAAAPFRQAGFLSRDLLPLIPPGAKLYQNTSVQTYQIGKIPGRYANGAWMGLKGPWPTLGLAPQDQQQSGSWPTQNVGLRAADFPAIDIDTESEEARAMVEAVLTRTLPQSARSPVRVRDGAPRSLYIFRLASGAEPFGKIRREWIDANGVKHATEILAKGQQYVISGLHPSGVVYAWREGRGIMSADSLPELSKGDADKFIEALEIEIHRAGGIITSRSSAQNTSGRRIDYSKEEPDFDPVMVLEALNSIPNDEKHVPLREDLIKLLCATKAALGKEADNYFPDVLQWASAQGYADEEYVGKIWKSTPTVSVPPSYLRHMARKHGWKSVVHKAPTGFAFPPLVSLEEAAQTAANSIEVFLDKAFASKSGVPYQAALVLSPGVGKTELILRALAKRPELLLVLRVLIFVPDNKMSAEMLTRVQEKFAGTGVNVRQHRGRTDERVNAPLCNKSMHGKADEIVKMGGSVAEMVCPTCPFHDTCGWIKQNADDGPGLVILPHSYLTLPQAEKCDVAIIDEQFLLDLHQERKVDFVRLTDTSAEAIALPDTSKRWQDQNKREADERHLKETRAKLYQACDGGERVPNIDELHSAGISHADANRAELIEYGRHDALKQILKEEYERCKSIAELQRVTKEHRERYGDAEAMAKVWKSIKRQLICSRKLTNERTIIINRKKVTLHDVEVIRHNLNGFYISEEVTEGGEARTMLTVHLRKDLRKGLREKPILALDATGDKRLLELALPHLDRVDTAYVDAKHATVIQVVNARNPKSKLVDNHHDDQKTKEAKARRREPIFDLANAMGGGTGVISYKGVYDSEQAADARARHKLGYYGLLRGQNIWKDVSALIVVGRNMPSPLELETLAGGLFYDQPESIMQGGKVEFRTGWHRMRDGSFALGEGEYHPDPTIELVRRQITEAELVQAIGRARGVRRGENNPVCIVVLTTTPMSEILIDKLVTAEELLASPLEVNFGKTGVHLATPAHAARVFPEAFGNVEAARKVFQKYDKWENPLIDTLYKGVFPLIENKPQTSANGESGALVRVSYKLAGKKQRPSSAVFDTRIVADPRAWLETKLGPLAKYETDTPAHVTRLYVPANDNRICRHGNNAKPETDVFAEWELLDGTLRR